MKSSIICSELYIAQNITYLHKFFVKITFPRQPQQILWELYLRNREKEVNNLGYFSIFVMRS